MKILKKYFKIYSNEVFDLFLCGCNSNISGGCGFNSYFSGSGNGISSGSSSGIGSSSGNSYTCSFSCSRSGSGSGSGSCNNSCFNDTYIGSESTIKNDYNDYQNDLIEFRKLEKIIEIKSLVKY
ncbi:hypothetical protein PIROE2DRAFT_4305 [Piromyces sp. E2]|nr:hypothetical protein PIROE2DRAFT_4305 [Piromyces sp. E2]|eukprot:OUM68155.1 hypothetical protein PIROE2DRAFT_4305 [Piromyces sp. E2]